MTQRILLVMLLCLSTSAIWAQDRASIKDDYKWKPEHIYASQADWEKDVAAIKANIDQLATFKGKFAGPNATNPAKDLIAYNKLMEETLGKFERASNYVDYHFHVDMGNTEWMGRGQEMETMGVAMGQKLSWVEPELLLIPEATLMKWVADNKDLQGYKKSYEDMYLLQAHTLSAPEEEILALSGNITGTTAEIYSQFTDVDMDYGTIQDEKGDTIHASYEAWVSYSSNKDRGVRERMFTAVWNQFKKYENTLAAIMAGNIKKDIYLAKARKYKSTLDRALSSTFIPADVYTNLVSTTEANTAPLHKYEAIRKRVLGLDHYKHWDYYVSLASGEEKRYTWEQGAAMVEDALKPLGKTYVEDITKALTAKNGWIDAYASKGKRGGAYSSSTYGIHPYMLFNFDYKNGLTQDDIGTIAHEVGHSMHTYYSEKNQPFPNKDYSMFNAEVASTTNETLMAMKFLDEARRDYKNAKGKDKEAAKNQLIYLLEQSIDAGRGSFFRQTQFAAWEMEAHKMGEEGKPLTAESFNKLYGDLLTKFYGPDLEYGELSASSWSTIPHFYRGYYVYVYATSYAAAVDLAQSIRAESLGDKSKKGSTERFLNYLRSGSSKHPVELLKDAGVDMTTPAPIKSCIDYWSKLVDELDGLTKPVKK
jgi:oligoendopeptidase F